ncbi:MAG: glycoside hydrolase family 78 protein [Bacteroidales bacterium]
MRISALLSKSGWLLTLCLSLFTAGLAQYQPKAYIEVTNLRTEYTENPVGIDVIRPRLSWETKANVRDVRQIAYDIKVATSPENLAKGSPLVWTSKKVMSTQSNQVEYGGPPLKSGERLYWSVRIWDNHYRISDWSKPAFWEMGLIKASDWKASWIEPADAGGNIQDQPNPYLRKSFRIGKRIRSARLYISAHGLYQLEINGMKPNDWLFTPGWTSYNKHLQYQTYDVTEQLQNGQNVIGVVLGNGWYRGPFSWDNFTNYYGPSTGLIAQMKIVYRDGSSELVVTDRTWKSGKGPVRMSEIYHGELYDARLEIPGWSSPKFNDDDWQPVQVKTHPKEVLAAQTAPPVRATAELRPERIFIAPNGDTVVDIGQNMVGWVRLKVSGKSGTRITLRHAEVLDRDGNLYFANLRSAKQQVDYILKGSGREVYEPHFTFQGFRYVKVSGYPGELRKEHITGIVIHSDMAPTGSFSCSDTLLNQLQHNIQWGLRGNFLDVPTDCPQRDERMGWTGDAQVFAPTACFNYQTATFFTKWLRDLAADQLPDGRVPHVIPDVLKAGGATGWADAAIIVPWTLYRQYGDKRILETQYPSMKAWVEYMRNQAGETYLWTTGSHFGDWLAFASNASDYPGATTDKDLIATAYFANSSKMLADIAEILDKKTDAAFYRNLFFKIRDAFNEEYVTPNGRLASNTQTAYALALTFDLVPENKRREIAGRFAADVRRFGHITTGFLGASLVNPLLSKFEYNDLAYMLLMRKNYPSWLYPVTKGATTIWERWDGIKADGSFQDPGMNSFNHYAYGAIGSWIYSEVAGLQADESEPAYKKIIIRPVMGGGLTHARAEHLSMYGRIESDWRIEKGRLHLKVTIPPNTTAQIYVQTNQPDQVTESGQPAYSVQDIRYRGLEKGYAVYETGSGTFTFEAPFAPTTNQ